MTLRSLFSGISGLNAQANALDVIGNNIANVSTTGFRRARITFSDLFYNTLSGATGASAGRGGTNPVQIGSGVGTNSIDTIFTQGSSRQTGRELDLGIRGGGFFQLTDGTGGAFFTRAGNFGLDEEGFITQPGNGLRVVGRVAAEDGTIDTTRPPEAIQIDFNALSPAVPTNNAILGGNLSTETTPTPASSLNTLVTLFNMDGTPLGLNEGDTIRIASGTYDEVPSVGATALAADTDAITVTRDTTLGELARALKDTLRSLTGSTTLDVTVDSSGAIRFESGAETLTDLVVVAVDRDGAENTSIRRIFGDGELDGDIDLAANSATNSLTLRQADATSSTQVFDSQGNSRVVITTFARDTRNVSAPGETLLTDLFDDLGNSAGIVGDGMGDIVITSGTVGGGAPPGGATVLAGVSATSTLEDLRAGLATALGETVELLPDGTFRVTSTAEIVDLRIGFDPDGAGATPPVEGALTRMFTNNGFGIDLSGTDGLDVSAGSSAITNSFHTGATINNSWMYQIVVPHDVTSPPSAATGQLVFQANGTFENYGVDNSGAARTTDPIIEFDPDGNNPENGGVDALTIEFDFAGISQNASTTSAAIFSQDGSPVGQLETIDISQDGSINGVFSNGSTRTLAQILLASFANPGGLSRRGDNLFIESPNSGDPVLGDPGTLSNGRIQGGELELSNVDLAEEFVNLILAQRAFQANARVITTGDEVLQELVNLVR